MFRQLSQGQTVLPPVLSSHWQQATTFTTTLLGQNLASRNEFRQGLGLYLDGAGIEAGYSYFAPHVPGPYKLVFELHYPDGKIQYETPRAKTGGTAMRIASLLDLIGQADDSAVREMMIKFLVPAVWREHPDASTVRAIFGTVSFPTAEEFARGRKENYRALCAYDVTSDLKESPASSNDADK